MEQFNEVAFTFNGTIAYMNISTSTKMAPEKEALLKRVHCFEKKVCNYLNEQWVCVGQE